MNNIYVDSVDSYNRLYGLVTKHPLVSAVDLREAKHYANQIAMKSELYGLFLKNAPYCSVKYGRKSYDFQAGTVVSFAPGQTSVVDIAAEDVSLDVIGLVFHPDLIYGTSLASAIGRFNFFSYSELESLHLSEKEIEKFIFYYNVIKEELDHPIDAHTAALVSTNIQLLLEHLQRFYDRQFITRHHANSAVLRNFENSLRQLFSMQNVSAVPGVAFFAEKSCLSVSYFSDLIRKESGMSPKDLIDLHLISEAKKRLRESDLDISQVAYSLGFDYPAHFSRIFKRIVGVSPRDYRFNHHLN